MKSNKYFILLLICSILLFSYSTYKLYRIGQKVEETSRIISNLKDENTLLKNSLLQTLFSYKESITDSICTTDNKQLSLKEIIKGPRLIFRIFEYSCPPCLNKELENISKLEKEGVPITIIASFQKERLLKAYLNEYDIKSEVYNLKESSFLFPFDKDISSIYCFILNKDRTISALFFPIQNEKEVSHAYYTFIQNELI